MGRWTIYACEVCGAAGDHDDEWDEAHTSLPYYDKHPVEVVSAEHSDALAVVMKEIADGDWVEDDPLIVRDRACAALTHYREGTQ